MARKGHRRKREGKFKSLKPKPPDREGYKAQDESGDNAKDWEYEAEEDDEKHVSSLTLTLERSTCECCGEKGTLCVVTNKRGVKTMCNVCHLTNSKRKTKGLHTKATLVEAVLRMSEIELPRRRRRKESKIERRSWGRWDKREKNRCANRWGE